MFICIQTQNHACVYIYMYIYIYLYVQAVVETSFVGLHGIVVSLYL